MKKNKTISSTINTTGGASDIVELAGILNSIEAGLDEGIKLSEVVDLDDLPVWADEPVDTQGIYSWDEDRVLVHDSDGWWRAVIRD